MVPLARSTIPRSFSIPSSSSSPRLLSPSSYRALHTIRRPFSFSSSYFPVLSRAAAALSPLPPPQAALFTNGLLNKHNTYNNTASLRMLTTGSQREKVKVLLVLYDGGKHAEEVSYLTHPFVCIGCLTQSYPPKRTPNFFGLGFLFVRDGANCPRTRTRQFEVFLSKLSPDLASK